MWTKDKIEQWHMKALPFCTVEEQRIKANKEAKEYYDACRTDDKAAMLEELADVYIANTALWFRYHDYNARLMIALLERRRNWDMIKAAVDCKMDINVKRKFVKIGREWRHIEGDFEDEDF